MFERFSDSAGAYITLDSNNPSVYKQLYRAAKAKLKLRIKATVTEVPSSKSDTAVVEPISPHLLTSQHYIPIRALNPVKAEVVSSPKGESPNPTTKSVTARPLYYQTTTDMDCRGHAEKPRQAIKEEPVKEGDEEAPLPGFFNANNHSYAEIESKARNYPHTTRGADQAFTVPGVAFSICCNNCDAGIPDAHWHCSICDDGDFDLCGKCVEKGILCDFDDHWLIKRFVKNGKVINSTTETIAPKKHAKVEDEKDVPGAFDSNVKGEVQECADMSRTCNSCVQGEARILFMGGSYINRTSF